MAWPGVRQWLDPWISSLPLFPGRVVPPPPLPHQHDCHSKSHTFEIPPDHTPGQSRLAEQTGTHTHIYIIIPFAQKAKWKLPKKLQVDLLERSLFFMLDLANSTDNTCDDPFRICTMIENCSISHVLLESLWLDSSFTSLWLDSVAGNEISWIIMCCKRKVERKHTSWELWSGGPTSDYFFFFR
jgi:hypothetical protein